MLSSFSAPTLLVGWQEGRHPGCKMLGVGLLMVMIWRELCISYSSSCHHHLHYPCSDKIQNASMLVPAYLDCPGKRSLLNECCCCCCWPWIQLHDGFFTSINTNNNKAPGASIQCLWTYNLEFSLCESLRTVNRIATFKHQLKSHNCRAPWKNRMYWYISFFRLSLNRVLFPMFCLVVEGEVTFYFFKYY